MDYPVYPLERMLYFLVTTKLFSMKFSFLQMIKLLPVLIAAAGFITPATAQHYGRKKPKQRFIAGAFFGSSVSQIDGDNYSGFNKWGIQGGLQGGYKFSDKWEINAELLFMQKGSRFETFSTTFASLPKTRIVHLNYMEVPIVMRYQGQKGKGMFMEVGGSFGRQFSARIEEPAVRDNSVNFTKLASDFNPNEVNLVLGCGLQITEHINLRMRYNFALTKMYYNPPPDRKKTYGELITSATKENVILLRNYQLNFALLYRL